jgi:sn-glycerol 3-phosphate transport system substrate-binding protein
MKRYFMSHLILCLVAALLLPLHVGAQDSPPPITVRFWHAFGGNYLPYMDRMIADFNQTHPGIVVEATPQGSYEDNLQAVMDAVEAQSPTPHILHLADVDSQRALDTGYFTPLEVDNGYFESVQTSEMAVAINLSLPMLYGNAQLLNSAGITALPTSLEELQTACDSLTAAGATCITWPLDAWLIENWLNGPTFTPEVMTPLATTWQALSNSRAYLRPRALADWEAALTSFLNQEVALLVASSEDVGRLETQASFEWIAGMLPGSQEGFVPRGGALWLTTFGTPEESAAAQTFIQWVTNSENGVRWHKLTGYLPLRPLSVRILEEQAWVDTSPLYALPTMLLAEGQNMSEWRGPQREINLIVEETMHQILQGNNIERTLANMAQRIETTNTRYGSQ